MSYENSKLNIPKNATVLGVGPALITQEYLQKEKKIADFESQAKTMFG